MRSFLILLGSMVLLIGGFFVYFSLQTSSAPRETEQDVSVIPSQLPPTANPASGTVAGPGEDVWVKSYDDRSGDLAFQFRAARYDPKPDGSVEVLHPQAELFTGENPRQVVRIEGKTGLVVMASDIAQRGVNFRAREASAPRRGVLRDVTITLYEEDRRDQPLMTCRMHNIAFDNDTYRIATEGYDEGRRHVSADEVRVEVRGEDFDFDGRGLTLRWNETDRRLQLLEIAHGESLTIKSPQLLRTLQQTPDANAKISSRKPVQDDSAPAVLARHAQAPGSEANRTDPHAAPAGGKPLPPVYRANFLDAVRVTQGETEVAVADQMHVDFISDRNEPVSTSRDAPAADRPGAPTTRRSPATAARPPAEPQTPQQPVVVRWKGKLRVTALESDTPRPSPGSLNIALSADTTPVVVNYQGVNVRCAAFDYRSGDDSLAVTSSKNLPLVALRMADGTAIHTPSIVYTGMDSKATLRGASTAELMLRSEDAAEMPRKLNARWEKSCVLTLLPGADQKLSVERALLDGDVIVAHPQIGLRSDKLDIGLLQGDEGEIGLEDMKADGNVRCNIIEADGTKRSISADHLAATLEQPQGTRVIIEADGNVIASDADQQLSARRLRLTFVPTASNVANAAAPAQQEARPEAGMLAAGNLQIESLLAQQDVKLKLSDGGNASGDQLQVGLTSDGTVAELLGQPAAILSDGRNTLTGPHIKFEQGTQRVRVHGRGTLDAILQDAAQHERDRPVSIKWDSSLSFDGLENKADIGGKVVVTTQQNDGTHLRLAADHVAVDLKDQPDATEASDSDSAPQQQAEVPNYFGSMRDKTWQRVTLTGDAQVQSILTGADESQYRRLTLLATNVQYEPGTGYALVPAAGKILIEDTLPRDAQTAAPEQNRSFGNLRGATAIQWAQKLEFKPDLKQATLEGDVVVVHQAADEKTSSMRVEAGRSVLRFTEELGTPATQPSQKDLPASFEMASLKLAGLTADGGVKVMLPQALIEGSEATYDSSTALLTARGSDRLPVHLFDSQGVSRGSFLEIVWNVRSEQVERMRDVQAQVRH